MNYKLSYGIKLRLDNRDCVAKDEFARAIWKLDSESRIDSGVRSQPADVGQYGKYLGRIRHRSHA